MIESAEVQSAETEPIIQVDRKRCHFLSVLTDSRPLFGRRGRARLRLGSRKDRARRAQCQKPDREGGPHTGELPLLTRGLLTL